MSKNYTLQAAKRDQAGKGAARSLRRENRVPAVIYGDKKEPVTISLDSNTINVTYGRGGMFTTVCDMDVDGEKHSVLARDIQVHPVTENVLHADFLRVTPKTKIAVNVPVHFINDDKSPALQENGILNVVRHEIELVCSAVNIPDQIEVNLEGKDMGDAVKVSDAVLPEGTKPVIDDRDFTIATLMAPRTIEEEEAADEEGAVDPLAEEGEEGAEGEGGDSAEGGDDAEKAEGKEE